MVAATTSRRTDRVPEMTIGRSGRGGQARAQPPAHAPATARRPRPACSSAITSPTHVGRSDEPAVTKRPRSGSDERVAETEPFRQATTAREIDATKTIARSPSRDKVAPPDRMIRLDREQPPDPDVGGALPGREPAQTQIPTAERGDRQRGKQRQRREDQERSGVRLGRCRIASQPIPPRDGQDPELERCKRDHPVNELPQVEQKKRASAASAATSSDQRVASSRRASATTGSGRRRAQG